MWKGYLKLALVSCPIALYKATSTAEKIAFNTLNRETGNRLKQKLVDSVTGAEVESEQRVKGYQVGKNQYVLIEEAELEKIRPAGDKIIELEQFVEPSEIDIAYQDERYYLLPDDVVGEEAFASIRTALLNKGVVGLGKVVLRSRQRPIMLAPHGNGLIATTLRYTAEVKSADHAFAGLREMKLPKELLEIATLLIDRKTISFDPDSWVDAYEQGLVELIKAKQSGQEFVGTAAESEPRKVVNLMDAFKRSLEETKPAAPSKGKATVTKMPVKGKAKAAEQPAKGRKARA